MKITPFFIVSIRLIGLQFKIIKIDFINKRFISIKIYILLRWLSTILGISGNLIVFFAIFFAIISRDSLSPGLAGLSITFALSVNIL